MAGYYAYITMTIRDIPRSIAVGVDLEEIERFCIDMKKKKNFLEKIFTKRELTYCFAKHNPAPHLAARFAAKEAVYKALSGIERGRVAFNDIEILRESTGAPEVHVRGENLKPYKISLSISHTKDIAAAFAIIYGRITKKN